MVVKMVSSVKLNVEDENTSFLSQASRVNDNTLLLDIKKLKFHDFISAHGKPIKVCFEDSELEEIFLSMNEQIMYLKDKVNIISDELVDGDKDFLNVTTRFAKLISKVHKLNKNFWLRLKFLFTGTKGWKDEFKELN